MHNPVHIQPFLEPSWLLGIHIGTSAIGRTAPSQRRMEGFQMIGMQLCSGQRLGGVGMLWIGRLIPWSFATALMPLRPFILEPHFDTVQSMRTLFPRARLGFCLRHALNKLPDKFIGLA